MNYPPYHIRNYRPADFGDFIQLHIEAEMVGRAGSRTSLALLCQVVGRPGCSPSEDVFVVEAAGRIVGGASLTPELGIGRAILKCLVHPEHRRKGLATELCSAAERRAAALGARVVQGCFGADDSAAGGLAAALGYRFVHRFLELELDLCRAAESGFRDTDTGCRHLRLGEEAMLAELQNRCFAGTWGFNPGTAEETAYRLGLSDCCPEGVILVHEGNDLAGYCWTLVDAEADAGDRRRGRIHMLGVVPECRGRGLGRRSLMAGLSYLRSREVELADISVDSENVEACALYDSVGFTARTSTEWYEKPVV
jgi:mycothiol synthase